MPKFTCSECGEKFDERREREDHIEAIHEAPDPRIERYKSLLLSKKFWGASIAIILMIVLPLGTGIFYSSVGSGSSGSKIDLGFLGGGNDWQTDPPVGQNIQRVPNVDQNDVPRVQILDEPLSKEMQVYLLVRGSGSQSQPGPAAALQYSCTNCPETVAKLEAVAESFNNEDSWVYVAPYPDMDSRVSLSLYQSLQTFDEPSQGELASSICDSFSMNFQQFSPLYCAELS